MKASTVLIIVLVLLLGMETVMVSPIGAPIISEFFIDYQFAKNPSHNYTYNTNNNLNPTFDYSNSNLTDMSFDYVVFTEIIGGVPTYYAKNGNTGVIDFNGTNASAVIQDSIDENKIPGYNYGSIFIKPGIYEIYYPINITHPINIIGADASRTILISKANVNTIDIYPTYNTEDTIIRIENLQLLGYNSLTAPYIKTGAIGLNIGTKTVMCRFGTLVIQGFNSWGIYNAGSWGNYFENCKILSCGNNVNYDTSGGMCVLSGGADIFINCRFDWCENGIVMLSGSNHQFLNCIVEGNKRHGMLAYSNIPLGRLPAGVIISNGWFENNNQNEDSNCYDLKLDGFCRYWQILGGTWLGSLVTRSIYIGASTEYNKISGIQPWGNTIQYLSLTGIIENVNYTDIDSQSKPLNINVQLTNSKTYVQNVNSIYSTSTSMTLDAKYSIILCDCTSGQITLTLPSAVSAKGFTYTLKKTDVSANVAVFYGGSYNIDNAPYKGTNTTYNSMQICSDGTKWHILSAYDSQVHW